MEETYVLTLEDKPKRFSELTLNFCGYSICQPRHSFGPAVRPGYILHFILSGRGSYQVGDCHYELKAGEGFLIEPDVMTYYEADTEEPWSYLWIGFQGTRADEMLDQLALTHGKLTFRADADCGEMLFAIVQEILRCGKNGLELDFFAQSALFRFFSCLAHYLPENSTEDAQHISNLHVHRAIEYIQTHYAGNITVADIAAHISVSRSYLSTLFQNTLGQSPSEYLANFRLTRGAEQLTITDLPVSAIAGLCGYRDPLVFSKAFKQKNGMTPTQYRKSNREAERITLEGSGRLRASYR